jgi:hypothetical protein
MNALDDARVRKYLLGRLSEEEAEALEGEYFARGEALEQVWGVENDLVDAYVAGELEPEEKAAFEGHYLASPLHRDRVDSARALRAMLSDAPGAMPVAARRAPARTGWLALAAGLLIGPAAWWLWTSRPQPGATAQGTAPTATVAPGPRPADVPSGPVVGKPIVAAFALSPVLVRGNQATPVLRVPPGTDEVAITLEGERPQGVSRDASLRFTVATVEGERVTGGRTGPGPGFGVATLAADRLAAGDYILSVLPPSGEDALCQYFFRVPAR